MSKTSFTPWRVEVYPTQTIIVDATDDKVCSVTKDYVDGVQNANAEFIVRACNNYQAMYEALENIFKTYVEPCDYCEGTGIQPGDPKSSCEDCGGVGRLVRSSFAAELGYIEDLLKQARGE